MQITLEQILSAIPTFDLETRIEIAKAALSADEAIFIDPALVAQAEEIAAKISRGEMETMTWETHLKRFEDRKKVL